MIRQSKHRRCREAGRSREECSTPMKLPLPSSQLAAIVFDELKRVLCLSEMFREEVRACHFAAVATRDQR